MFLITLAATVLLAGTEASATAAPTDTAAPPAAAAQAQPKMRKVCYVEDGGTGSRVARKICHNEVVKDEAKAPEAPKTEQK